MIFPRVVRFFCVVPALSAAVLCFTAFSAFPAHAGEAYFSFTDDTGAPITLETPAERIITLYPAFSEILNALDASSSIIGTTRSDGTVSESLPRVGTHLRPNAEIILALKPDIVLQMHGQGEELPSTEAMRSMGLPVAVFRMNSFDDLFRVTRLIGDMTGKHDASTTLVANQQKRLNQLQSRIPPVSQRVTVFYEVRYPNLIGAGPDTMSGAIIHAAGGLNVLGKAATEAESSSAKYARLVRLNEEKLIELDPAAYLVQQGPMNRNPIALDQREHFASLSAVRNRRWTVVPEDLFARPGPRSVDAAEQLARFLYPQRFK